MTNYKRKLPIKDPIYGYVRFSYFEREIINHPLFQRLHWVLQNSTVYVSFPSNKTSRFTHSLGVSELAGEIFRKSLSNSSAENINVFIGEVSRFIKHIIPRDSELLGENQKKYINDVNDAWSKWLSNSSQFAYHPIIDYKNRKTSSNINKTSLGLSSDFLINTCWVAVKICALVHDIGHLPMSHSFEQALEEVQDMALSYTKYSAEMPPHFKVHQDEKNLELRDTGVPKKKKSAYVKELARIFSVKPSVIEMLVSGLELHEVRGLMMLDYIRRNPDFDFSEKDRLYRDLILNLATAIMFSAAIDDNEDDLEEVQAVLEEKPSALRMLKSIVAGEIDADRLDYVARDGLACGTQIGGFDRDRIVDNAIMVRSPNGNLVVGYYHRAVTAIEQFFQSRYEGYKYLIYHRTAARSEAALRELIARIFHYAYKYPTSSLAISLESYGYLTRETKSETTSVTDFLPANMEKQRYLDDSRFRSLMVDIFVQWDPAFNTKSPNIPKRDWTKNSVEKLLKYKILVLLDVFLNRKFVHLYNPLSIQTLEQRLIDLNLAKDHGEVAEVKLEIIKAMSSERDKSSICEGIRAKCLEITKGEIFPIFSFGRPKIFRPTNDTSNDYKNIFIVDDEEKLSKIEGYSAFLRNMSKNTSKDEVFNVSFVGKGLKTEEEKITICEDIFSNLIEELACK